MSDLSDQEGPGGTSISCLAAGVSSVTFIAGSIGGRAGPLSRDALPGAPCNRNYRRPSSRFRSSHGIGFARARPEPSAVRSTFPNKDALQRAASGSNKSQPTEPGHRRAREPIPYCAGTRLPQSIRFQARRHRWLDRAPLPYPASLLR